jgi:hypothetical protein
MASHKERRNGYFGSGRSGGYVIKTPNGVAIGETHRSDDGDWPVFLLGSKHEVARFNKADLAFSAAAHRAIAEVLFPQA